MMVHLHHMANYKPKGAVLVYKIGKRQTSPLYASPYYLRMLKTPFIFNKLTNYKESGVVIFSEDEVLKTSKGRHPHMLCMRRDYASTGATSFSSFSCPRIIVSVTGLFIGHSARKWWM